MKKVIIMLFAGCFLLVGCGNNEEKFQEIFREHGKEYYEKYMSGVNNQTQAEVTLEMLKTANRYNSNFDLSELDKCDDSSKVILTLDENKNVINYEFELKCN